MELNTSEGFADNQRQGIANTLREGPGILGCSSVVRHRLELGDNPPAAFRIGGQTGRIHLAGTHLQNVMLQNRLGIKTQWQTEQKQTKLPETYVHLQHTGDLGLKPHCKVVSTCNCLGQSCHRCTSHRGNSPISMISFNIFLAISIPCLVPRIDISQSRPGGTS